MSELNSCCFDVYVKESRLQSVLSKFARVSGLFDVKIDNGSQTGKQFMPCPGRWFKIHGVKEQAAKAREYVKGLADPEEVVRLSFPSVFFDDLFGKYGEKKDALEKDTAANITFHSKTEVEICGCISGVTKAASYLESTIQMLVEKAEDDPDFVASNHLDYGDTDSITDSGFADDGKSSVEHRLSGIIIDDSEESVEEDKTSQLSGCGHLDCYCSQGSDGERDENRRQRVGYVDVQTTKLTSPHHVHTCDSHSESHLTTKDNNGCCSCQARTETHTIAADSVPETVRRPGGTTATSLDGELMEYALKLGYSEQQAVSAMQKIDSVPVDQNQLLHELIKGSTSDKLIGKSSPHDEKNHAEGNIVAGSSRCVVDASNLRHIVIDGSNVAMSHGKNLVFSCRGIQIVVDWFRKRSHTVTVFVPNWRKEATRAESPIIDQKILCQLEEEGVLSFTPSRRINGRLVQCYDDRYIVRLAFDQDGVIVSNDHFRDLYKECPEWREFIENRLLMYTFANGDIFMPPDDPLGRQGPTLEEFLKRTAETKVRHCPYGKKCTFGPRCKFFHPERSSPHATVAKNKLPLSPQHLNQLQQCDSRPRSDPGQHNLQAVDNRQRPTSLPNLEQLYVTQQVPPYVQQFLPHHLAQGRPVSGPPFPEMQPHPHELHVRGRSLSELHMQQQHAAQWMVGGEFPSYPTTPAPPLYHQMRPPCRTQANDINGRPRSCCDFIGRPLSSDFGSRPSSGDYSYAGGSRPASGEFSHSRPSSGEYTSLPWHMTGPMSHFQRPVSYTQPVHSNQIAYVDTRNFYPVKGYHKSRAPPVIESKEERPPNVLRIELVEQLRQIFPEQYDRILTILRSHPNITALEEAMEYMNE